MDKTSCYFLVKDKTTFMAADQYCVGLNGNLVSIHNMFENAFLGGEAKTVFTDSTNIDFWIGANNLLIPKNWSWMDGTPWDFNDWDIKQPINVSNTNCGAMTIQSQRWISDDCIKEKPFVCLVKIHEATTTTTAPLPCPNTWTYFNETKFCYKAIEKSTTWWDAEMTCVNQTSHLIWHHITPTINAHGELKHG
uniref:C-type lectin domain-containing protein n=1 Tax=Panagrolaimus sp. PS1159 TaxID=55785 RepID=A0AC35F411_9BILA